MTTINFQGYLERKTNTGKKSSCKASKRNWWLVKINSHGYGGWVNLGTVSLPKHLVGKRIRFKVEVIEEKEE